MYILLLPLLGLVPTALASPASSAVDYLGRPFLDARAVSQRAAPDSPSGNYAPSVVDCPQQRPTIRSADTLSQSERDWLRNRRGKTIDPLVQFLRNSNLDFDAAGFVTSNSQNFSIVPNIGIAMSGGGYRALLTGAGVLAAADSRVPGANDAGGIGGLLQSATYLSGLSGGSWLVGSIFANNFSSVTQLRDGYEGSPLWQFSNSIFEGPRGRGLSIVNTARYWDDVSDQVDEKRDAGFDVSITDYWGRALSVQLINAPGGGPAYTFSSIADAPNFASADTPLPIIVVDERAPNTLVVSLNATVHEVNPWEMGTFDPTVYGFVPTRYVGSNFSDGRIPDDGRCLRGFDSFSFVMGTSSSLFNTFLLQNLSSPSIPELVTNSIRAILTRIGDDNNDIAAWNPNPFRNYNQATNPNAGDDQLTLVDGGMDLQNIPLQPLIQPARAVDVIFAVDSSADTTTFFPNGTALRATYERSQTRIANGTVFPRVPDAETFINLGLNRRPTFFGCDTSKFSSASRIPPLVVYLPNTPYSFASNVSTFDPTYTDEERDGLIRNGYHVATMGNGTLDADWRACAACAIMRRSLERTATAFSAQCRGCFDRYCWNGTVDSTPVGSFEPQPSLGIEAQDNGAAAGGRALAAGAVYALAGLAALFLAF
ncbi:lysophospholipase catalytic domain-containing protein [Durotheca rogersii]|uniref:lysophospholipase catalytic domain-containing protein n=1 Tax=Durotheca rogersii TaxID=419775 RepID=UPI002220B37C|nr:lysophospholipase catalytic domain-containing protein [Durotheca rogersii]KAI5859655.1 lysophospholipase catalytic domain-containing protein [Durotheca rogersii]